MESETTKEPPVAAARPRRVYAIEIGVFLVLILPTLVLGALIESPSSVGFAVTALATIARDIGLVFLVLYFLWRNGEPFSRIGWSAGRGGLREALIGVVLFVPVSFAMDALRSWLGSHGVPAPPGPATFLQPSGSAELALAIVLVVVVAVAEETVFRGYFLLRFGPLMRSMAAAVVASSVLFGMGHGYEGAAGMLTIAVLGVVLALVYLWRGSLIAPIVMHFLQDFIGIVLLPGIGR